MKVFLKANAASLISSFCDYVTAIILHEFFKVPALTASITGTVIGGIANFFISRYWVFKVQNIEARHQLKKFIPTWFGNLLLNVLGVKLLLGAGLNYIIAKLITSVTVAVAYNYPLQKKYVFKNNE